VAEKPRGRPRVEPPPVRILVVVANTQTRPLRAEAEKGSARTAVGRGSVDPKGRGKPAADGARPPASRATGGRAPRPRRPRKGIGSRSPNREAGGRRRRERTRGRRRGSRGGFSLLLDGRARPRNRIDRRSGRAPGRVPRLPGHPGRPRRTLKTRGSGSPSRSVVPITAAGLRGEQPLADRRT
jgi:hypothetical protein